VGNVRNKNSRKRGRPSSSGREERLNGKMHFIMQNKKKKINKGLHGLQQKK
jgi:hypothetical protein